MKEVDFLSELENKAQEQKNLVKTEIMPDWAKGVGGWLSVNPWRVIVPLSVLGYVMFRIMGGGVLREFVLGLFGGFV